MNTSTLPIRSMAGLVSKSLMATTLATIGNVIIYLVSSFLNISFTVPFSPDPFTVTIFHVIGESILMAVIACMVFAILCRLSPRGMWLFRVISVVVLLASFIFPLLLPTDPPMKISLSLMHIFSALAIVSILTRNPQSLS